jgi:hypothetical protein
VFGVPVEWRTDPPIGLRVCHLPCLKIVAEAEMLELEAHLRHSQPMVAPPSHPPPLVPAASPLRTWVECGPRDRGIRLADRARPLPLSM